MPRSQPEVIAQNIFDSSWVYENNGKMIPYTAYYKPDWVRNKTIIEIKQYVDQKELNRLRYVNESCIERGELFIVLVFMSSKNYGILQWMPEGVYNFPIREHNLVKFLRDEWGMNCYGFTDEERTHETVRKAITAEENRVFGHAHRTSNKSTTYCE